MVATILFHSGFFLIGWCAMGLFDDYRHGYRLRFGGLVMAMTVAVVGWWLD